jgi:rhamnosyltransferase subunit B
MTNYPCKHFVVVTAGTAGDMYPYLRIALAFQRQGHQVTFLGPELYERHARQAGVTFQALGSSAEYLTVLNDPDLWHPRKSIGVVLRSMRHATQALFDFIEMLPAQQHCVLLAHPLALPAAAIARASRPDMRIVTAYLAPSNLRTVHDPLTIGPLRIPRLIPLGLRRWFWGRIDAHIIDPIALPDLNAIRQTRDLPPVRHLFEHLYGIADLSVTLFPSWFGKHQPDWPQPMRSAYFQLYDPQPEQTLSPELMGFMAAGDKPIVFTPGTGNLQAAAYFNTALQASNRLGRRAIFLTAYREQVPPTLPDTVLWQAYVPLRVLLPHVAALVHHGGIGTTAEGLRAGIPQLVVPLAHDQFDNAMRVQQLGVGDTLSTSRLRVGTLTRTLKTLLSSAAIPAQCASIAARFAEGDDEEALCREIEGI